MQLKRGYTMTDIGVLPEAWPIARIRDVASITTGKRNTQDRVEDGKYPFFVRSQTVERINSYSFDGEAVLTAGDGVGTGKVFHYINEKFDFHQRVYKMSDFSPDLIGYYFFLYFSSKFYNRIMSMTAKSSVDSVRLETIAGMMVPVPPADEQRAIAAALSDMDALLEAQDRLIAKKRDLKQGVMQQLLTAQSRLPGFSGQWQTTTLGTLGALSKGKGIRKDDVLVEGLPCIRYGEIYTHHNDIIRSFQSFVSRQTAQQSRRLRTGDLVFTCSGETAEDIGKCVAFVGREEAYVGGDTVVLSPAGQDSQFLGYLLNHPSVAAQKARMGQGDAVVHISARNLASLAISIPKPDEQHAIGCALSDIDAEIAALEERRDKTRSLKQGMMQELLTGRTRLA